ncbi:MAG: hypothetical protein LBG79_00680 [Spirochaetaceae bacterium]|jgi:hypothetical protein|nr:hypothetical protein [Spirochaetaceae bacterium]
MLAERRLSKEIEMFTPTVEDYKRAREHWSKICQEGKTYSTNELYLPGDTNKKIKPSDYCYNKTNKGSSDHGYPHNKKEYLCFMFISRGKYQYKGFNKAVTCKTVWKDANGKETVVGEWVNGKYTEIPHS